MMKTGLLIATLVLAAPSLACAKSLSFPGAVFQNALSGKKAAIEKLKASARSGNAIGEDTYGDFLYARGHRRRAVGWYRKAALQNNYEALLGVGTAYLEGVARPQSKVIAAALYRYAVEVKPKVGREVMAKVVQDMEQGMSKKQIADEKRLARAMRQRGNYAAVLNDHTLRY